jgi:hypothetical protein
MIKIICKDNQSIILPDFVSNKCVTLYSMIDDLKIDAIEISIDFRIIDIENLVAFCTYHKNHPFTDNMILSKWDLEFFKMSKLNLLELIKLADYLNYSELVICCSQVIAKMVESKLIKELKKDTNI